MRNRHFDASHILRLVVFCAPLARLFIHNQQPAVGIADVHPERIVALGQKKTIFTANLQIGFSVQQRWRRRATPGKWDRG